jgi:hypothetical protein
MFVEISKYRSVSRIRIMNQVKVDGTWKRQLVEHIGSAKDDTELKLLKAKAEQRLEELKLQKAYHYGLASQLALISSCLSPLLGDYGKLLALSMTSWDYQQDYLNTWC